MSINIKKTVLAYMEDLLFHFRRKWIHILLSLIFCVIGIALGIAEITSGNNIFVKIYGDDIYLIFVKISSPGKLFFLEFFPSIILAGVTLLAIFIKWLYIFPDCIFLLCSYLKTISILYLFIWGGVYGKIMAILFAIPCFIVYIVWYFTLKLVLVKNNQFCQIARKGNLKHDVAWRECLLELILITLLIIGEILVLTVITMF